MSKIRLAVAPNVSKESGQRKGWVQGFEFPGNRYKNDLEASTSALKETCISYNHMAEIVKTKPTISSCQLQCKLNGQGHRESSAKVRIVIGKVWYTESWNEETGGIQSLNSDVLFVNMSSFLLPEENVMSSPEEVALHNTVD